MSNILDRYPIKAIGFDLDGTLLNSLPGIHQSLNLALTTLDIQPLTENQTQGFIGNGIDILLERAIKTSLGEEAVTSFDFSSLRHEFDLHYHDLMLSGTLLYPNVIETLNCFKAMKLPLALITNKPSQFLPDLLQKFSLTGYFDWILGGDDVSQKKPHPAPLYFVLSQLGLHAQEFLFVGDSKNDIQCAKYAGVKSAGLTYGYNYHEPINLAKPDFVFEHFNELLTIFNNDNRTI